MSQSALGERVRVETREGVVHVVLARPDKHNGMDLGMLQAVNRTARELADDRSVKAVVLRGDGPSFCAGLDFKAVMSQPAKAALAYTQLWWPTRNDFQSWSMAWRDVGAPVIAAIHGNCFGAGLQLALGADIRVAAPNAQLSVMEAKWGLVPDMGGMALMRELVPIDVAKELTFTGRVFDGDQALRLGLVSHVAADPVRRALAIVEEIAQRSPDATAAAKHLLHDAWHGDEAGALAAERRWQRRVFGWPNQRRAVQGNMKRELPAFVKRRIR